MRALHLPISRRAFCRLTAGCAAAAAIAGCVDDGGVVDVGPLGGPVGDDDGTTNPGPDGGPDVHPTPDAHPPPPPPDASPSGPQCAGGETDTAAPGSFADNSPVLYSSPRFFVVRDAGGLYAVSSRCTHENAENYVTGGHFRCPRHGATFTFDGSIISGPVNRGLVHYAMCILPSGHVGVDTSTQVPSTQRLVV